MPVSALGGAIIPDFVHHCNMIACRAGGLNFNFLATFLLILLPWFGVQIKRSCSLDPPWNNGQKKFRKCCPKTCSKHIWTLLRRILSLFAILNCFDILESFRRLDPLTLGENFFLEKIAPKHVQNTFGRFLKRFWAFMEFWNFFDFFENFWRIDPLVFGSLKECYLT